MIVFALYSPSREYDSAAARGRCQSWMLQLQNSHGVCEFCNYMSGHQLARFALVVEASQEGILDVKPAVGIRKGFEETTCGSSRRISLRDGLFGSAEDLALRIPLLNRKELTLLACKTAHWKCARMTSTNPGSRNGYSEDLNSACRRHTCCGPESS